MEIDVKSPYLYNLILKSFRRKQGNTLEEIQIKLKKAGISYSKGQMSRIENGNSCLTESQFKRICTALHLKYEISDQKQKICTTVQKIRSNLVYKYPATDEIREELLNYPFTKDLYSDQFFVWEIFRFFLCSKDSFDLKYEEKAQYLIELVETSNSYNYPVIPNDFGALVYYSFGIYRLHQCQEKAAFKLFNQALRLCNGKTLFEIETMLHYQQLRCFSAWHNPHQALSLCIKTLNSFMELQAYSRCWDVNLMKLVYLVRSRQFDPARSLCQKLWLDAKGSGRTRNMSQLLSDLVWLEMAAGNPEEALKYMEYPLAGGMQNENQNVYRPYALYQLGKSNGAFQLLKKMPSTEGSPSDQKFNRLLQQLLSKDPQFARKAVKLIEQSLENAEYEVVFWCLELLGDYSSQQSNLDGFTAVQTAKLEVVDRFSIDLIKLRDVLNIPV